MRVGSSAWHLLVMPGCCLDLQCSSEGPYVGREGGGGGGRGAGPVAI